MTDNDVITRDRPLLLVVTHKLELHGELYAALQSSGWQVEIVTNKADIHQFSVQKTIAASLVDLSSGADVLIDCAQTLRSASGPSAATPILALRPSPRHNDPVPTHVSDFILDQATPDSIVRELERWRPVSLDATRRIAEMFGPGPIAGMIERLARRLEPALANLERGVIDRSEAHRLAGLCGTLGFGQAHAAWLDLSLGDETIVDEVRRTTRLVLAAVARGL